MYKVDSAIIMAAGKSKRMRPLSNFKHKALLEVGGEVLIERQIRQLQEVGIGNIIVVTGYLAEQFSYLEDKFGIKLIYNSDYNNRNNHSSIYVARNYISNTYICSSDNFFLFNPFNSVESETYYSVVYSKRFTDEWCVAVDKNDYIREVSIGGMGRYYMYGHVFWDERFSAKFLSILEKQYYTSAIKDKLWEDIYIDNISILNMKIRPYPNEFIYEFDTIDQYNLINFSDNKVKLLISQALNIYPSEIDKLEVMKKGMTNLSYTFLYNNQKYIVRLSGEGTSFLINRYQEECTYKALKNEKISDDVIYINSKNGCKITKYFIDSRVCNPKSKNDICRCMLHLKKFHELHICTEYNFNIFEKINFYESLVQNNYMLHDDYDAVKADIISLKWYVEKNSAVWQLCHIDSVSDNFLFTNDGQIRLIDWEYAGNYDPHVDIAMFAVYSNYDEEWTDFLIDSYFSNQCTDNIRLKIYCYVAICGFMWSNWCDYKLSLGKSYGEYATNQYKSAKKYYEIAVRFAENRKIQLFEGDMMKC